MCNVINKVLCVFNSAGKTHQIIGNTCRNELFVIHLTVGCTCRVQTAGSCIGNMSFDCAKLKLLHECLGSLATALYAEGYNAAASLGKIFLGKCIVLVALKIGIFDPCNLGMILEELCNLQAIEAMIFRLPL